MAGDLSNLTMSSSANSTNYTTSVPFYDIGFNPSSSPSYQNYTLTITTPSVSNTCINPCPGANLYQKTGVKCFCNGGALITFPDTCTVNCSNILYTAGNDGL